MIFPNIFRTYDTRQLNEIFVNAANQAAIMADLRRWTDFFNGVVSRYENLLSESTTDAQGVFGSGSAGGEMQAYTEYGETLSTATDEAGWPWGAPIRRYRDRQQYTEEYLASNTLDQINKDAIAATNRAYTTRLKILLRSIFNNVTVSYIARRIFPETFSAVYNLYPFFNADSRPGTISINGASPVSVGAMQSYLPSGSATFIKAQLTLARTKLRERGLLGRVTHMISAADADTVRGFVGFLPRVTQDPYANTTTPPATTAVVQLPEAIGTISDGGATDGEVVVFPFFPALYSFSFDATAGVPLRRRQHPLSQFQGFQLRQDQTRAAYGEQSLLNKRWEFIGAAGVANQANGVVVKATAGAYSIPSLAIPMA